jgi:hypothetical protein
VEDRTFETFNADLATFLLMHEMELIEFKLSDPIRKKVSIVFRDPIGQCIDLEQTFINSDFKKYRDINKYCLRKIHEKLRGQ